MNISKNPTPDEIAAIVARSKYAAARRIVAKNGDAWYWPAEEGTHREGADFLGIEYNIPPGMGDIITI